MSPPLLFKIVGFNSAGDEIQPAAAAVQNLVAAAGLGIAAAVQIHPVVVALGYIAVASVVGFAAHQTQTA